MAKKSKGSGSDPSTVPYSAEEQTDINEAINSTKTEQEITRGLLIEAGERAREKYRVAAGPNKKIDYDFRNPEASSEIQALKDGRTSNRASAVVAHYMDNQPIFKKPGLISSETNFVAATMRGLEEGGYIRGVLAEIRKGKEKKAEEAKRAATPTPTTLTTPTPTTLTTPTATPTATPTTPAPAAPAAPKQSQYLAYAATLPDPPDLAELLPVKTPPLRRAEMLSEGLKGISGPRTLDTAALTEHLRATTGTSEFRPNNKRRGLFKPSPH